MGKKMRQGAKQMAQDQAKGMRPQQSQQSQQRDEQRRQDMSDQQGTAREAPGPVRMDEQTDELT